MLFREVKRPACSLVVKGGLGVMLLFVVSCTDPQSTSEPTPSPSVETTLPHKSVIHEFTIPDGTAGRLLWAEDVNIIPNVLDVRVGDKIRVHNEDSELVRLGIFDVRPGETVSMAFNTPGELKGVIFSDQSGGCGPPPPDAQTF